MAFFIIILILLAILSCFLAILAILFLLPIFQGAPFIPTDKKKLPTIIKLAGIKSGQKIVDLGSGDGRLVIALAKAGAEAHGYEINPFLVWWSRYKIKRAGLKEKAFVHQKGFWRANLQPFDLVVLFGIGHIMEKLEKKLKKELKPGAKVVSNCFTFPNWQHSIKEGPILLYIN